MESKTIVEIKKAVEEIERIMPYVEGDVNENNYKILLTLARQYLAVVDKGGVPKKREEDSKAYNSVQDYTEGWNACHDAFIPLLVAKERELEALKSELLNEKTVAEANLKTLEKLEAKIRKLGI